MNDRHARLFAEILEDRIAPAGLFTYTDVDGDTVTIKTSKGSDSDLAAIITAPASGLGQQVQEIDFSQNAAVFQGTSLTITAKRSTSGGDGFVNIGFIDASDAGAEGTGVDLGAVKITGDLGRILVGDDDASTVSLKSLEVQSIGRFGTSTQAGGGDLVSAAGDVGKLVVKGDIKNARFSADEIASVSIGGSLIGGAGASSGRLDFGDVGTLKVGGNVEGGAGTRAGDIVADSIKSVTVGGSLLGGAGGVSGAIEAGALGTVKIGGDLRGNAGSNSGGIYATDLVKSIVVSGSLLGGNGSKSGTIYSVARVESVKIIGNIEGGLGDFSGGISAISLGTISLGGDLIGGSATGSDSLTSSGEISIFQGVKSITIGGDVIAGTDTTSGTFSSNGAIRINRDMGSLTVKGALIGNTTADVLITASGKIGDVTEGTDLAIGKLTVAGRVEFARILGGYSRLGSGLNGSGGINADAQIGPVSIGGDWIASSLAAGTSTGPDNLWGTADDLALTNSDAPGIIARIASITIKGQVLGTIGGADHFGFVSQSFGPFKTGATLIPIPAAPSNSTIAVGSTGDITVREVLFPI